MVFGMKIDVVKLLNSVGADLPSRPVLNAVQIAVLLFPVVVLLYLIFMLQIGQQTITYLLMMYAIAIIILYIYVKGKISATFDKYELREPKFLLEPIPVSHLLP